MLKHKENELTSHVISFLLFKTRMKKKLLSFILMSDWKLIKKYLFCLTEF